MPEDVELSVHEIPEGKLLVVLPENPDGVFAEQISRMEEAARETPPGLSLEWRGSTLSAAGRIDAITAPALRRELERAQFDVDLVLAAVLLV